MASLKWSIGDDGLVDVLLRVVGLRVLDDESWSTIETAVFDERSDVCAAEPFGHVDDPVEVHVLGYLLPLHVDREYLLPRFLVGQRYRDDLVEPTWPDQRRVDHVYPVGRRQDHDAVEALDAVELGEELADHPLGHHAVPSHASRRRERVDLVEEDHAWRRPASPS